MTKIKIGGIYRHYKGTYVKVLSLAKHSETKEDMVVYVHLEDGQEWVRPLAMFCEKLRMESEMISRFEYEPDYGK